MSLSSDIVTSGVTDPKFLVPECYNRVDANGRGTNFDCCWTSRGSVFHTTVTASASPSTTSPSPSSSSSSSSFSFVYEMKKRRAEWKCETVILF